MTAGAGTRTSSRARTTGRRRIEPKPRGNPEIATQIESTLEELRTESESGAEEDHEEAAGDDQEAFDPIDEYGVDPSFDDGSPDERGTADTQAWDRVDGGPGDRDEWTSAGTPDVLLSRHGDVIDVVVLGPRDPRAKNGAGPPLDVLCGEIMRRQAKYFESGDMADLKPMTQADLVRNTGLDKGTVARLVRTKRVRLPWGTVAGLADLLCDPTQARVDFIAELFRHHDAVTREPGGVVVAVGALLTKHEVVEAVQREFGAHGNSEQSIRAIMKEFDLPHDVKKRGQRYTSGSDWWS